MIGDRRSLGSHIAIVASLVFGGVMLVLGPAANQADRARAEAEQFRVRLASTNPTPERLAALRARRVELNVRLGGFRATQSLATPAALNVFVQQAAARAGVEIDAVEPTRVERSFQATTDAGQRDLNLAGVRIAVRGEGTFTDTLAFIQEIESREGLWRLDSFELRPELTPGVDRIAFNLSMEQLALDVDELAAASAQPEPEEGDGP
jgi:hypothetical protein